MVGGMRVFLMILVLGWGGFSVAGERPNVLVVLTDDQGWGDLSLNGNANLQTPNIDGLARDGARFERFYVCPVCSPTRAEFLTGRYHVRGGVYSTSAGGERLDLDEVTVADVFRGAGYGTGAFGKWHNGMQYPYHPNGRGFDEFYGFCSGHWGNYFSPMLERNGEVVTGEGFCVDDFTEQAMGFMEGQVKAGKPFFCYVPYNTPHSPMQVPERFWGKFKDKELGMMNRDAKKEKLGHSRAALAMCENIDWNVGRMLGKLDELGVGEETIVVYFCDNGPNGVRWNGGMRGRKGSTDEGGVRSPLLVRWPGVVEGGRVVEEMGAAIDLLPTLAELAGVKVEGTKALDGVSLAGVLKGGGELEKRYLVSNWKKRVSVGDGRWRLDEKGRLYDLASDPGQGTDVAAANLEKAAAMRAEMERFRTEVMTELPAKDERAFVVGHPDVAWTQVPARDGVASGGIERSNRFPNCSYFRNWTTTEERIEWEAEVLESGDYEVEIYYTCPAADVGSVVELSFNGAKTSAKVVVAHDPPELGAAEDRVVRMESYVKDFRPISLGVIGLKKGAGTLSLRALEVAGKSVMEFRLMMLRRVEK